MLNVYLTNYYYSPFRGIAPAADENGTAIEGNISTRGGNSSVAQAGLGGRRLQQLGAALAQAAWTSLGGVSASGLNGELDAATLLAPVFSTSFVQLTRQADSSASSASRGAGTGRRRLQQQATTSQGAALLSGGTSGSAALFALPRLASDKILVNRLFATLPPYRCSTDADCLGGLQTQGVRGSCVNRTCECPLPSSGVDCSRIQTCRSFDSAQQSWLPIGCEVDVQLSSISLLVCSCPMLASSELLARY